MPSQTAGPVLPPERVSSISAITSLPSFEAKESLLERAKRILCGNIRQEDYLAVPDDVIEFVDGAESRGGMKLLPEYRRKMISQLALQIDHGGISVLVWHTADGVVILGAGPDEVYQLIHNLPPDLQTPISLECPPSLLE